MAPTNILRGDNARKPGRAAQKPRGVTTRREIVIRAGRATLRARLLDTPTADRIWQQLPIYSSAEPWGESIHFETPVESGREADARQNVKAGEIAFWVEDDRVIIGYGMTPLSKRGEIRLPSPANIWAVALDDVKALAVVGPGERVAILHADS
jgi:uncharacterized protein